jgi:hypothetical protein
VNCRISKEPAIRDIRFTARIASQCAHGQPGLPDRIVCDTIANGSRNPTGRRGIHGGPIVLFKKAFPGDPPRARNVSVSVLGEITPQGCYAIGMPAGSRPRKIWENLGFFNRAVSK